MKKALHVKPVFGAVVLVGVLTACGSTLQSSAIGQVPGGVGATSAADGGLTGAGTGTASTGTGTGTASTGTGTGTASTGTRTSPSSAGLRTSPGSSVGSEGSAASGGTPAGGRGRAAAGRGASAPGVTAKTMTLGFVWVDESGGTNGLDPDHKISFGNQTLDANAMTAWLNDHGGIAGRKVKLNIASMNYAGYFTNAAAENQAACVHETQDDPAFLVANVIDSPELTQCLEQHAVPSVSDTYVLGAQAFDANPPGFYAPGQMDYERAVATMVQGLKTKNFLHGAKVGIFYDTEATFGPVLPALKNALAAAGVPVVSTFGDDGATASGESADASSAVLRFRAAGVNTVMFISLSGALDYLFMNVAQSQDYYPKYGLSSADNVGALAELGSPAELRNALVVGWIPGEAASEQARAKQGWNPTGKLCYSILTAAGADMSSYSSAFVNIEICDDFLFAKAMVDKAPQLTMAGLALGADALGTSYQSAVTFSTRIDKAHHDGAMATRFLTWGSGCSCWQTTGPGRNASH